ncbi:uncharacterized protein VP01_2608g1 [Puccinia sorghi]|uniref:hAT-like transposase RNase-H fold domain-containing protein n=1 Tax=Puccinia sorghi TaxID=27349 RepID=A0A0L6V4M3_9BASI|nr:uncharacterized protein VP01_2608g1 [Puccinia sorghi]
MAMQKKKTRPKSISSNGKICGSTLKKDCSHSGENFEELLHKTVLKRVHGFRIFVQGFPKQREWFAQTVHFIQPNNYQDNITVPVLDNNECHTFSLKNEEWEQASHIIEMLNSLSAATELLCGSEYPTLNSALPIYLILIKRLTSLKKHIYICAMIIDPQFKMHFWKSQLRSIEQHCSQSLNEIKSIFFTEARKFYITTQVDMEIQTNNQHQNKPKKHSLNQFDDELFCVVEKLNELEEKIARYLQQDVEPKETKILAYWLTFRRKLFQTSPQSLGAI